MGKEDPGRGKVAASVDVTTEVVSVLVAPSVESTSVDGIFPLFFRKRFTKAVAITLVSVPKYSIRKKSIALLDFVIDIGVIVSLIKQLLYDLFFQHALIFYDLRTVPYIQAQS